MGQSIKWALNFSVGWLELGLPTEALTELEKVSSDWPGQDDHERLRLHVLLTQIFWSLNKLDAALLHSTAVLAESEILVHKINHANLLRQAYGAKQALAYLQGLGDDLPASSPLVAYNMACYSAGLGLRHMACGHLKQAFRLDGDLRFMAMKDPDLKALIEWMPDMQSVFGRKWVHQHVDIIQAK